MSDSFSGGASTNIRQGGKEGGEVSGDATMKMGVGGSAFGGDAFSGSSANAGISGGGTGLAGGDLSDNTSIGSININS